MDIALYNLSDHLLLLLFFIALIAGIVDAIAGGGGLITVPALLLAGVPPMVSLGTNRLQAVIGEATSFMTFLVHKKICLSGLMLGAITTAIGAMAGSYAVSIFDQELLSLLLPILMIFITAYSIFSASLKKSTPSKAKLSTHTFMLFAGLVIGFYNGFFGPGTGSIWMVSLVILLGYTIKQASIKTKPLNLMGNVVSLMLFMNLGFVDYKLGVIMAIGQIIGSIIGSKMVMKQGDKIVRPIFISVTLLMTCKLIYELTQQGSLLESIEIAFTFISP